MPGVMPLLISERVVSMKRMTYHMIVAVLTFSFGLACVGPLRVLTSTREEVSLGDELMPQPDLYREVTLRAELSRLRRLLDQYAAEHAGGLRPPTPPRSLHDLVREGYLPEIPADPITGRREWQSEEMGCPSSGRWHSWGIIDIRSKSSAVSSEGTRYNEW